MAPTQNKGLIFRKVPSGLPVAGQDLTVEDRPIDLDNVEIPSGGLLVHNIYASFDPYQRGRMRDPSIKSYAPPYVLGEAVTNSTVAKVLRSNNPDYKAGDVIVNFMAGTIEEYSVVSGELVKERVSKYNDTHGVDPVHFIGALGMPGLTAYSSFYAIGEPKKGETIFVSAASGAVGQLVGQLAKHEGLKVIGSVGDDEKLSFILDELKFDAGFNYKKESTKDALKRLAPNGIDIYYENVGGETLEAAIDALNQFGRIIACGMISQYNNGPTEAGYGVKNLMQFVAKRLKMQGFIVGDPNMIKYRQEHISNVSKWIADGSFKAKVHITEGIDNSVEGLLDLFRGKNFGKSVLKISEP